MCDFKDYISTKCELLQCIERLQLLEDEKGAIFEKYFSSAAKTKEVVVSKTNKQNDNYINYLHEINKKNEYGFTLDEEIIYLKDKKKRLEMHLKKMDDIINSFEGLEYSLIYKIVCEGKKTTKAVQEVAEQYNYDERTIWRKNKDKVKKYTDKIKKIKC